MRRASKLAGAVLSLSLIAALAAPPAASAQAGEPECSSYRGEPVPASFEGCEALQEKVQAIASFMGEDTFKLDEYEAVVAEFLERFCHRNAAAGWVRDKTVRDTGPYIAPLVAGEWGEPHYHGTHQPVVIWYDRSMIDWLEKYRPEEGDPPAEVEPIPDGAIMIKEMYPAPAARCDRYPPEQLEPPASIGVALMIRDNQNAHDGWFWGAWWDGFTPDWPAKAGNGLLSMGFGAYCTNCHASARDNLTFADLQNVQGQPGEPNYYLSQNFLFDQTVGSGGLGRHRTVLDTSDDPPRQQEPLADYDPAFLAAFPSADPPGRHEIEMMPSQTYDHVWVPGTATAGDGPGVASQFLTSDQCIGCHDAGSTGLQFDMTEEAPALGALLNLSPYATWRTSPMGLGGRDPIFFAQLASETETFHPTRSRLIQDICLGCHGIQGQRQFAIDQLRETDDCGKFQRSQLNAIPYPSNPADNPQLASAHYGGLGRDGIACTACHHMALTEEQIEPVRGQPQNECVEQRQQLLNPENVGFAKTFTGSFFVGPPDELYGPFDDPKEKPMEHALGITPVHDTAIKSSEVCGSCHTVHLPVYGADGEELGFTYEQTTYPEWAFSAYRTGVTPDGEELPAGRGALAQSCQGCHMKSSDPETGRFRSKIASIQELSSFPATDNTLPGDDIDLAVRDGFARHTLVGLNLFFVEMAQQFPDVLGIPTQDPMLVSRGLDPVLLTELRMLEQAADSTVSVSLSDVAVARRSDGGDQLTATVTVDSQVGHKFPSGVGFRRAFLELAVLDAAGEVLWASGRTDGAGAIVDQNGQPIDGEYWWQKDCSARLPGTPHQPHYRTITAENQAQIYQELVTSPAPPTARGHYDPVCGHKATPGGQLTTSFLSICGHLKDNRILPHGFLDEKKRIAIAEALGAGPDLAEDSGAVAVGDDPDYVDGGRDSVRYEIDLGELAVGGSAAEPVYVRATLYYQAIPPFYLQDRFCTSQSADTERLYFLTGHLDLANSPAEDWKLRVAGSGLVALER